MSSQDPVPFEIFMPPSGPAQATNGRVRVAVLDAGGTMVRRRGLLGIKTALPGDVILPQLNKLAGELVGNIAMPASEIQARLLALAAMAQPSDPQRVEWLRASLDGVQVFTDGVDIVVTKGEIHPGMPSQAAEPRAEMPA
ncbi:MAG: hypothetical protein ACRC2H_01370 [Silanimonas sp.]